MTLVAMPVFNEIDFDGRVERCAQAVGKGRRVVVYALDSGKPYAPVGFETVRVAVPALGRLRILRPFLFWLGFLWWAIRHRPAVVHAHDYYMAFPGWLAARLVGAAFVYDAHELLVPRPGERHRLSERIYYRLEGLVVGRAEVVIAANRRRAEIMAEHYGLPLAPEVVRNIPSPEAEPEDSAEAAGVPGLPPKRPGCFRLIYQGYLAERFHLDHYVAAVAALGENVEIVMCGPGPASEALAIQAARDCPGRVHLLGRVPRRFLKSILRTGDAGIIVYGSESLNEIHCAPNKVFEYAMAGLPSIANSNPGLKEIVEGGRIGVAGDDALANIQAMMAGRDAFQGALPGFLEVNSWAGEAQHLADIYARLAASNLMLRARSLAERETEDPQRRNRLWWERMPMTYADWQTEQRLPDADSDFLGMERILLGASPFLREEFDFAGLAGRRVLDLGSGSGVLSCLMAKRGAEVVAVDITEQGTRLTRANALVQGLTNITVVRGDAESLPLADASFDYVLSWGVIHHSRHTERAIAEIARVLRPGGRGLVMVYHRSSLFYYAKGLIWLLLRGKIFKGHTLESVQDFYVDGYYHRHFTGSELGGCFQAAGLRPTAVFATQQQEKLLPLLPMALDEMLKRRFGWYLVCEFERGSGS